MRNAVWAERLIACLTGRSRAASIVGDLLETEAQQGASWFWLSVARILLALLWRPTIAFVVTFFVGLFWRREFMIQANILPYQPRPSVGYLILLCLRLGIPGGNMSEPHFRSVWFGTVLWMAVSYTAIRYGLRDKFAQIALGLGCLVTIAVFFSRTQLVFVACVALVLSLLVSVWFAQWRRPLLALAAAVVVAFGCGLLSMYLKAVVEYPLARWDVSRRTVLFCFWILAVGITTAAFSSVHGYLLRHDDVIDHLEEPSPN